LDYDLRLYPDYLWEDASGTTLYNNVPSEVSKIYFDYNATHIQQCYLTGTPTTPRTHPFSGDPSSYSSVELTERNTGSGVNQSTDYIVAASDDEFSYRYLYYQFRLRVICNGETIASDWSARPVNIAFIIEADDNNYCGGGGCGYGDPPSWTGTTCYPTYRMTDLCDGSSFVLYVIDSQNYGGAVDGEYGIYDTDGTATTYRCARFEETSGTFGSFDYFEGVGELYLGGYSDCTDCTNNLP